MAGIKALRLPDSTGAPDCRCFRLNARRCDSGRTTPVTTGNGVAVDTYVNFTWVNTRTRCLIVGTIGTSERQVISQFIFTGHLVYSRIQITGEAFMTSSYSHKEVIQHGQVKFNKG